MAHIHRAFVEEVGNSVLNEENNCEDAVNGIAYEAYCLRNGSTPFSQLEHDELDEFLREARRFVKKNGRFYNIEWEEF